jgi:hypothetical protein
MLPSLRMCDRLSFPPHKEGVDPDVFYRETGWFSNGAVRATDGVADSSAHPPILTIHYSLFTVHCLSRQRSHESLLISYFLFLTSDFCLLTSAFRFPLPLKFQISNFKSLALFSTSERSATKISAAPSNALTSNSPPAPPANLHCAPLSETRPPPASAAHAPFH